MEMGNANLSFYLGLAFPAVNTAGIFPLNSMAELKFSWDEQSLSIPYSRTAGVQSWSHFPKVEKWGTVPGRASGNSQLLFHCNDTIKAQLLLS